MSIFNLENIFDEFSENVPEAFGQGESYLRAVARYAKEARIPVSADVTEEKVGGTIRGERELFLVLTPVERRLRRYPSYHYARPVGTSLNVGWFLLGQIASRGLGGWAIAGGASQRDIGNLEALIRMVHEAAVIPAMQAAAAVHGYSPVE